MDFCQSETLHICKMYRMIGTFAPHVQFQFVFMNY